MTEVKISKRDGVVTLTGAEADAFVVRHTPSVSKALEQARSAATARIEAGYSDALSAFNARYIVTEREGWGEQIADAKAHQAGEAAPLLTVMAEARGISADAMAARVLSKWAGYRTTYAEATGTLGKLREDVETAETIEALTAIDWPGRRQF